MGFLLSMSVIFIFVSPKDGVVQHVILRDQNIPVIANVNKKTDSPTA